VNKIHNFTFLEDLISCDDSNDHKFFKIDRKHKYEVGEKRLVAFGLGMRKKKMFQHACIMAHKIKEK
jgi:hypothetical protein